MRDISDKVKEMMKARGWSYGQLAQHAGLPRTTVVSLIERGSKRTSMQTITGLAKAFGVTPESLYNIKPQETFETFTDLWERARLAAPVAVPVYDNFKVSLGEVNEMPVDYVYYSRQKAGNKHLEAFKCAGSCMEPLISDGDTIIVDVEASPQPGDIVLCLVDEGLICGHYKSFNNEPIVENSHGSNSIKECQRSAVVVGVYKSFK